MTEIALKRAYDAPSDDDGVRVLVDRLWPRGISKERLRADAWCRDSAPSGGLRKSFGHDPEEFPMFEREYRKELDANPKAAELKEFVLSKRKVTLLYSARDREHNNAAVLAGWIAARRRKEIEGGSGCEGTRAAPPSEMQAAGHGRRYSRSGSQRFESQYV